MLKIKLDTTTVPPQFPVEALKAPGERLYVDFVSKEELINYLEELNAWIRAMWTTNCNVGWLFCMPCIVSFVHNDLLLRNQLPHIIRRTFAVLQRQYVAVQLRRVVRVYGFGDSCTTVVKYALVMRREDGAGIQELLQMSVPLDAARQVPEGAPMKQVISARSPRRRSGSKGKEEEALEPSWVEMDDMSADDRSMQSLFEGSQVDLNQLVASTDSTTETEEGLIHEPGYGARVAGALWSGASYLFRSVL